MRGLHLLLIKTNRARLDGLEPVDAILVGARAAKSDEGRIEFARPLISRMIIAAMRVGLPDFDHCVRYRNPVPVENAPLDTDALACGLRLNQHMAAGVFTQQRGREKWADRLGSGQRKCGHYCASP